MARTRKTVTPIDDDVTGLGATDGTDTSEPEVDDDDDPEAVEEPAPKPVVRVAPQKTTVTVILQEAVSLTVGTRKFLRNVPQKVPIADAKFFREHGWFRVV